MTAWHIERLGRRGDGIAVTCGGEGPQALAALTLPGEEIEGEAADGRIARPRILVPSPDRITAPCPHYRTCGGCSLMHARDPFVAAWKRQVVEAALAAQGIAKRVDGLHVSPPRSRRRTVLSGRRTRGGAIVGFHARASHAIADLVECRVLRPAIVDAFPILRRIVMAGGSREGELALTVTEGPEGLDLAVRGGKPADGALLAQLGDLARDGDLARVDWAGETLTRRAPWLPMGVARVVPPPGGFLQATAEGEAALVATVLKDLDGARRVADLFAGCGTFTFPIAARAEVHAVEGLGAPLDALAAGWRNAPGLRRVTTESRDLARNPLTPEELDDYDAIVIDPPRAGAAAQAREIAASHVSRLVWIACDPVTFARDMRVLCTAKWCITRLQVVDQFRWSPHVEIAASLTRS